MGPHCRAPWPRASGHPPGLFPPGFLCTQRFPAAGRPGLPLALGGNLLKRQVLCLFVFFFFLTLNEASKQPSPHHPLR